MYSVLQNRSFQHVDEILAGSTPSAKVPTVKANA
jgi:hypothetical protein